MTVIAIDFGTSNTAIAILITESDRELAIPKTLHFNDISQGFETAEGQAWLVPSLVYVLSSAPDHSNFLFGKQARSHNPITKPIKEIISRI